jgi:hypothetical protein
MQITIVILRLPTSLKFLWLARDDVKSRWQLANYCGSLSILTGYPTISVNVRGKKLVSAQTSRHLNNIIQSLRECIVIVYGFWIVRKVFSLCLFVHLMLMIRYDDH